MPDIGANYPGDALRALTTAIRNRAIDAFWCKADKIATRYAERYELPRYRHDNEVAMTKYLALNSLITRTLPPDLPLSACELSVFSQNGEDGVLYELCRQINPDRSFVEFGAETGCQANCVLLADVFGWEGLFIEANPHAYASLAAKYPEGSGVATLQEFITPDNINAVLERSRLPHEFGVLSIDIDSNDYWVWKAVKFRPAIVVIEYNAALPLGEAMVQPYEEHLHRPTSVSGASLRALEELGRDLGYNLVHTDLTGVNAFFVRADLAHNWPKGAQAARRGVNYYLRSFEHHHRIEERTDWVRPARSPSS